MNVAEGGARDAIAEGIADFVSWLFGLIFGNLDKAPWVLIGLAGLFVIWRLSLLFGPSKVCWHCGGKGHSSGLFGGRKKCSTCGGSGLRPRVGSGGR
jgi:hypothetical protein